MAAGRAIPPAASLEVMYAAVTDEMLEARIDLLLANASVASAGGDDALHELETINAELARRAGGEAGLTWSCMVCERERPDALISVAKRPLRGFEDAFPRSCVNVRYCNDSTSCRRAAETADRWHAA